MWWRVPCLHEPSKDGYSYTQFSLFDLCTEYLQSKFEHRIMRHILNTSGIVRFPERQYDMVWRLMRCSA